MGGLVEPLSPGPSAVRLRQTWPVPAPPLIRKVRFGVRPWGDDPDSARELLPYIDNVSLVDLVSGFEHAADYDVPGAYGGIVLDHFNFGDLTAYLTGQPESAYWEKRGVIALLGCDCGEVGCWPLEARVLLLTDQERDRVVDEGSTVLRRDSAGADEDRDPLHDGGEEQL